MEIKIESQTPKNVEKLKLAPIWPDKVDMARLREKKEYYWKKLEDRYVNPFFLSGIFRYVEKGETLIVRRQQFFVNDCTPKAGIVSDKTIIEIEEGFSEEVFRQKQVLADEKLALKYQERIE
mmetsp:Transcript_22985/g.17421  ORF Transcript_22985/g.17421 Transcript_22985/m.17421 type:complete len:122 (+) Transcript_22985:1136-1501(+)|eukprot:CAMPEP_0202978142 /NCGR_PEP_ID=MMETSP1396-20130829/84663_1 /ASSEMBLY_ACC=CAM_ASM_000872 /TAXON_ID= /ORGANISM="Pseudokeronopsis sp., Strain Brazil" /LENGTH=121 /DNA_ID=CAMNT_0049717013 /DNA_START=1116 /DNA_END=1481 /DNA_ORIENTATION=+